MSDRKMHDNEIRSDVRLVRQLLTAQFPQWAKLPITLVQSMGTDNALYRLGTDMCVRLPRISHAVELIGKEERWLPQFAPSLPLLIPVLLGKGNPSVIYPWHWAIYSWLEGDDASMRHITDLPHAAIALAQFLRALQQIDIAGGPPSRRGVPLAMLDNATCRAIEALQGVVDTKAVTAAWQDCLNAPVWEKPPVWIHGDLLPANLLVRQGKLSAVIDFGCLGIGDPACDLIVAWSVFTAGTRDIFRTTLAVDDATWMRGRGWALSIALIILPYYKDTNPGLVAVAKRMLDEIFAE